MISKIRIFIKLSNTLSNVLNKDEKNKFFRYLILSVINTFLEIASISVIILMLFVISGQDVSRSQFNFLFFFLPLTKSIQNLAFLMISIIIFKTAYQIIFNYNQEKISYNIARRVNISLYKKFINSKYIDYANKSSADVIRLLNQEAVRLGNQIISPLITVINEMFLIIFIISYTFADHIYNFLVEPYAKAVRNDEISRRLIFTALHETFITYLKVAFLQLCLLQVL